LQSRGEIWDKELAGFGGLITALDPAALATHPVSAAAVGPAPRKDEIMADAPVTAFLHELDRRRYALQNALLVPKHVGPGGRADLVGKLCDGELDSRSLYAFTGPVRALIESRRLKGAHGCLRKVLLAWGDCANLARSKCPDASVDKEWEKCWWALNNAIHDLQSWAIEAAASPATVPMRQQRAMAALGHGAVPLVTKPSVAVEERETEVRPKPSGGRKPTRQPAVDFYEREKAKNKRLTYDDAATMFRSKNRRKGEGLTGDNLKQAVAYRRDKNSKLDLNGKKSRKKTTAKKAGSKKL
jgi:hypothetical protein